MCQINQNQLQTLATLDGLGSVTLCGCGTISLHVGGVSVRMERSVLAETVAMCQDALRALPLRSVLQPEPTTTLH